MIQDMIYGRKIHDAQVFSEMVKKVVLKSCRMKKNASRVWENRESKSRLIVMDGFGNSTYYIFNLNVFLIQKWIDVFIIFV